MQMLALTADLAPVLARQVPSNRKPKRRQEVLNEHFLFLCPNPRFRRNAFCASLTGCVFRCLLYTSGLAGAGEQETGIDTLYAGDRLLAENGRLVADGGTLGRDPFF